jgi:hypothetical protein
VVIITQFIAFVNRYFIKKFLISKILKRRINAGFRANVPRIAAFPAILPCRAPKPFSPDVYWYRPFRRLSLYSGALVRKRLFFLVSLRRGFPGLSFRAFIFPIPGQTRPLRESGGFSAEIPRKKREV